MAAADVVVAIDSAAQLLLGGVEVEDLDAIDADGDFDFLDEFGVFSASKIIASGEEVGGIQANSQALGGFNQIDDRSQMFQAMAQATPLPCGDFQACNNVAFFDAGVNEIERGGDALQACFFT